MQVFLIIVELQNGRGTIGKLIVAQTLQMVSWCLPADEVSPLKER